MQNSRKIRKKFTTDQNALLCSSLLILNAVIDLFVQVGYNLKNVQY